MRKNVVNVNIENSSGETPPMIASSVGHAVIVRKFLKTIGHKLKKDNFEKAKSKYKREYDSH